MQKLLLEAVQFGDRAKIDQMIAVWEWSKFLNDIFQFSCSGVSFILSFPWPCSPGIKMTSYP